ncbi:MAG: hypothetical protein IPO36_07260 [Anaerolineales bacterium]|nr:hypothetical protein [Anaerolineales bacterium]
MLIAISTLSAGILILLGILLAMSPGKPAPFLDENGNPLEGSISEKIFVEINGIQRGMFIKGKDVNNPVLLYLHGKRMLTVDKDWAYNISRERGFCR